MEKINLKAIANTANEKKHQAKVEHARTFVESCVIPLLGKEAQEGRYYTSVRIPAEYDVTIVQELILERVECKIETESKNMFVSW